MLNILAITLPIFALILAGWGARRLNVMGAQAAGELNRYVVFLALPAMLFDIIANAHVSAIWQPRFAACFALGTALVFMATLWVSRRMGRHLADAALDGLNGAYANTGFIGFPLMLAVVGPLAMAPTLLAAIITVCALFGWALILVELGLQAQAHPLRMAGKVLGALMRNPLLVAPMLGAVVMLAGVAIPAPVNSFLKLLGASASPCALVGLGLFLGECRDEPGEARTVAALTFAKLVVHPALTWVLAVHVFALDPVMTRIAVVLAALPTGTGPFMVAEFHGREAGITSRTILVSTLLSLITVTVCIALVG